MQYIKHIVGIPSKVEHTLKWIIWFSDSLEWLDEEVISIFYKLLQHCFSFYHRNSLRSMIFTNLSLNFSSRNNNPFTCLHQSSQEQSRHRIMLSFLYIFTKIYIFISLRLCLHIHQLTSAHALTAIWTSLSFISSFTVLFTTTFVEFSSPLRNQLLKFSFPSNHNYLP